MSKSQVNIRLSAEAIALLDTAADTYGGKSQAIEAALRHLAKAENAKAMLLNAPAQQAPAASTNDKNSIDLPAALEQAARELRSLQRIARFAKL